MSLIDYFLPTPILGALSDKNWGAPNVQPRDPLNGLEDGTLESWDYWDGQIVGGGDGTYHLFASRWDQALGHEGWFESKAIHAVSGSLLGPYTDQGLCWPDDEEGKGHNVTALVLPDGRYAVVISETRPGLVYVSDSPNGPWNLLGPIQVDPNRNNPEDGRMSNVSIMIRPDGDFQIVPRSGAVMISKTGILGPYLIQGPSIYSRVPHLPKHDLEDPVIWYSGGRFHLIVNCWSDRKAYHLTSRDGIGGWENRGIAYDPDSDFVRYENGVVNRWNKIERPSVYLENGHVRCFTFAVIDVPKEEDLGNAPHGSKIIVVPFDGESFDLINTIGGPI